MARVRNYRDEDLQALARLWHDSWISTGLSNANDPSLAQYEDRLATEGKTTWSIHVAVAENELLGFMAYQVEPNWLRQLFVQPALKRRGIGSLLLDKAKQEMPEGFWLRTNAGNVAARMFYEKQGLSLDCELHHPVFGHRMVHYLWHREPLARRQAASPAPV